MPKKAYWELLKDPRWQRMRLEVLQREGFACQECCNKDQTLHVHHTYHAKGRAPWEYEPESLRCLCEDCHAGVEHDLEELRRLIGQLDDGSRPVVRGYLLALLSEYGADDAEIELTDYNMTLGVAHFFGCTVTDLDGLAVDGRVTNAQCNHARTVRMRQRIAADLQGQEGASG